MYQCLQPGGSDICLGQAGQQSCSAGHVDLLLSLMLWICNCRLTILVVKGWTKDCGWVALVEKELAVCLRWKAQTDDGRDLSEKPRQDLVPLDWLWPILVRLGLFHFLSADLVTPDFAVTFVFPSKPTKSNQIAIRLSEENRIRPRSR